MVSHKQCYWINIHACGAKNRPDYFGHVFKIRAFFGKYVCWPEPNLKLSLKYSKKYLHIIS